MAQSVSTLVETSRVNEPLSVVIPVFNGAGTLRPLVHRLETMLAYMAGEFEVVLVNDGSRDESWEIIQQLAQEHTFVRGINLMRNYGQHNALLVGVRAAQYPVIVTMDDDLQHPPEEIPKLLKKLAEGYDVVYGTPREMRGKVLVQESSLVISFFDNRELEGR